jgi:hypothetical protein
VVVRAGFIGGSPSNAFSVHRAKDRIAYRADFSGLNYSPFHWLWRQRRIARRVLDVAMAEIRLDSARVVAIIGELIAAGMAQHVRMGFYAELGRDGCPLDHAGEARRR